MPPADPSALKALESFIVENDDLLELEELIGRFNLFDALRIERAEIRHSNFLGWLLDPEETHGQGDLFLKAILMDLLKSAPTERRPLSPVELDDVEFRGVDIRREWRHIDLLIRCANPEIVIAIENKIHSGEHGEQLQAYENAIAREFPGSGAMFVFLTVDQTSPSRANWIPYSYADIHRVLGRAKRTNAGAIGTDVQVVLDHYLRLIGSRFMNDERIQELCRRIYKTHRQAIDLIIENAHPGQSPIVSAIVDDLRSQPQAWTIVHVNSERVAFIPASWENLLPPIGTEWREAPTAWLPWHVYVKEDRCFFRIRARPTSDSDLRHAVVSRLVQKPDEFHLSTSRKSGPVKDSKHTNLCTDPIDRWDDDQAPETEDLLQKIRTKLALWSNHLRNAPAAIRAALGTHRESS